MLRDATFKREIFSSIDLCWARDPQRRSKTHLQNNHEVSGHTLNNPIRTRKLHLRISSITAFSSEILFVIQSTLSNNYSAETRKRLSSNLENIIEETRVCSHAKRENFAYEMFDCWCWFKTILGKLSNHLGAWERFSWNWVIWTSSSYLCHCNLWSRFSFISRHFAARGTIFIFNSA